MKRYEITIKPQSGMGTPLKGDTLFGHFCWQVAYQPELVQGGLEAALKAYGTEPFVIFSSAVPKISDDPPQYILKRPDLPLYMLFKTKTKADRTAYYRDMKKQKSGKWMIFDGRLPIRIDPAVFRSDQQLSETIRGKSSAEVHQGPQITSETALWQRFGQPHNTINRLTGTTAKGAFAPYSTQNIYYAANTRLAVFILLDEKWTAIERVLTAMTAIGRVGFGRDATIGMGRFDIVGWRESACKLPAETEAVYTLGPCVITEKHMAENCRFTPFTRFGRHGDRLAVSRNPFKTPVLMADEGAVILPGLKPPIGKPYVGSAVTGVSKVQPTAVVQGYTPYLSLRLEKNDAE